MKIRFLFYRAKFEWRNFLKTRRIRLIDDLISWWTWPWNIGTPPYAHVEAWLPDKWQTFFQVDNKYSGVCYSSTMRGEANGTRKEFAQVILRNPSRWDYIEVEIEEDLYYAMKAWMDIQVDHNQGYDFKAILSFFWPKRFHNGDKYICSEFCYCAAVYAGIFSLPFKVVSPRRFARMLVRAGHRIERLKGE